MKTKHGVTLVEITLAALILVTAIIPLITMSHNDASKAVETEKIQMAERILESVKSELMTTKFNTFYERGELENPDKNYTGPFVLSDGYFPSALSEVVKVQQQYKDFEVIGTWSYVVDDSGKPDKTMVQAEVSCSFSRPVPGHDPIIRKKAFLIVKP